MSSPIQDPDVSSQWFIGSAAEAVYGVQVGEALLVQVHPQTKCAGRHCVMHNPSEHAMRDWPLNWRDDRGIMERFCPHGIGHPDPDEAAYQVSLGRDIMEFHTTCDGCCSM